MDNMSADNKTTTIEFENKSGVLLNTNYWLAGADYEDKNANEIEDRNDDEKNSHKDDIEQYEGVDTEEHCKRSRRICRHA